MCQKARLLLADGTSYEGVGIGAPGVTTGELCFNTGMTGYQEMYSDPSYYGQILISTAAHIGNYGTVNEEDEAAGPQISGVVLRSCSSFQARTSSSQSLHDYLTRHKRTGIAGVDTRALVRHLGKTGAQNALICNVPQPDFAALKKQLAAVPAMAGIDLSASVTTPQAYDFGSVTPKAKLAVLDFGVKRAMLRHFTSRKVGGRVFPASTSFAVLAAYAADGYFLSNGPGDPAAMDAVLPVIQELLGTGKPLFGICLGHQLLARAYGVTTYKLPFGHRGLNHPILDNEENKAFISVQNHGFAVDKVSAKACNMLRITHVHLNDGTVSGLRVKEKPVFSVQFHPEATPGPQDGAYLFDKFVQSLFSLKKENACVSHR